MAKDIRCPKCGAETDIRRMKTGPNVGRTFHVCLRYPKCKGVVEVGPATNRKKAIVLSILLFGILLIVGLSSWYIYGYSEAKIALTSWGFGPDDSGLTLIEGTVQNDGNKRCDNGVVEFNVYGRADSPVSTGPLIGVYSDFFSDLEAGETYAFEIITDVQYSAGEGYQFNRTECLD